MGGDPHPGRIAARLKALRLPARPWRPSWPGTRQPGVPTPGSYTLFLSRGAAVLGWVTGTTYTAEELHRIFYTTRFSRRLDKLGYARFRRWRLYGEQGVAGAQAAVWLYGDLLTLEFADAGETSHHNRSSR